MSLRYDLTVPFARFMASERISSIKRFHIAKVYRRDQPQMSKGRFREFYQCDFDIAGQYSPMLPDSEVLKVVDEILSKLNIGKFVIKVNHRKFLDAMVEIAGCEKRKFKTICSSIDKLGEFVELRGKPMEMLEMLKSKEVFKGHKSGEETIKEMELLFSYISAMGDTIERLSFDFSLARGLDYYTGLIYEAVLLEEGKVGSISGGGRYDGLIGMFAGTQIPAIGVSIGIERVFAILEEQCKNDPTIRQNSTQVLVA